MEWATVDTFPWDLLERPLGPDRSRRLSARPFVGGEAAAGSSIGQLRSLYVTSG
ncbi:MAG TPA: hypothetical protein VM848_12215 [Acidimicrobiia bacterium]|nr:hypothetical protein [Acidimicrobiia bacterium]